MSRKVKMTAALIFSLTSLSGCSYNPFITNNHETGDPIGAVAGAAVGVGAMAAVQAPKPFWVAAGIGGGALGYYMTTLRYDSGGVMQAGGQVYKVGQFVGIYIPSDKLFEPNTDEFLPQAGPILDSAVVVLQRYPNNNILISGNTSGFARPRWEQKLSERRAQKVSAYLWNWGVNSFKEPGTDLRKLNYVGYGEYFPISTHLTNEGLRQNSRIQITSYPDSCDIGLGKRDLAMHNFGGLNDEAKVLEAPRCVPSEGNNCDPGASGAMG